MPTQCPLRSQTEQEPRSPSLRAEICAPNASCTAPPTLALGPEWAQKAATSTALPSPPLRHSLICRPPTPPPPRTAPATPSLSTTSPQQQPLTFAPPDPRTHPKRQLHQPTTTAAPALWGGLSEFGHVYSRLTARAHPCGTTGNVVLALAAGGGKDFAWSASRS